MKVNGEKKYGVPIGATTHKASPTMCLAVGCERTALYRTGSSMRGYCRVHRGMVTLRREPSVEGLTLGRG